MTSHRDSPAYTKAKLALRDVVRRDRRLSLSARVVGEELISRSWEVGGCDDSQQWFVTVLGIAIITVKAAITELKNYGYIEVRKVGRANQYFLKLALVRNSYQSTGMKSDNDEYEKERKKGTKNDPLNPSSTLSSNPAAAPNGAATILNEETELFRRGKAVLGGSAGGLIAQLLKAKNSCVPLARAAIEQASTKQNPREYIGAIIRGRPDQRHTPSDRLAGII